VKVGAPVLDVGSAICAVVAILAALRRRDRSGEGSHVETSLLDFSLSSLSTVAQAFFATGVDPERMGSASPSFAPYQAFATADGYMAIAGSGSEDIWRRFCGVLGRPDLLEEERFRTNADRVRNQGLLIPTVEADLRTQPTRHWLEAFESVGVPCGPINSLSDLLRDPHVGQRGVVLDMRHDAYGTVHTISAPLREVDADRTVTRPAPLLGEHTAEVLSELGYRDADIKALQESGIAG
jgi:crotonobetainyl-CoA:carnitine CoA-transferase CaiB-like acyl-CoA transferase